VVVDLLRYDSTNPFAFNGDSKSLIRAYAAKEKINLTPADLEALSGVIDQDFQGLGESVLPPFQDSIDYLIAREMVAIYLSGQDETAIASAASALLQRPRNQLLLAPLSTALQGAISRTGDVNWGVSNIGDGQQILAGITSISH
jgi:hypothetical protein